MATNNIIRVLAVEDCAEDRETLAVLPHYDPSIQITFANDGKTGLDMLLNGAFDIALLDQRLPYMTGRKMLNEARAAGVEIPIMIITGYVDEFGESDSFDDNADDYILKPFDIRGLISRIKRGIRSSVTTTDPIIRFKNIVFDTANFMIHSEGITPFRFKGNPALIFAFMLRCRRRFVTEDMLITAVWHDEEIVTSSTVTRNVNRINEKLMEHGLPRVVKGKKETGYELIRD